MPAGTEEDHCLQEAYDRLSDNGKKVVQALWFFRPGAHLSHFLVKLAVNLETREYCNYSTFNEVLSEISDAQLLTTYDEAAFTRENEGNTGYVVPESVSKWTTGLNKNRITQGLFREPQLSPIPQQQEAELGDLPASTSQQQPAVPQGGNIAEAEEEAEQRRRKQRLFAAFLAAYGNVQGSVDVPKLAESFLNKDPDLKLGITGWAHPRLSDCSHAARLACLIEKGLPAETVIAAVVASSQSDLMSVDGLKQGLRQLFDIFISSEYEGKKRFLYVWMAFELLSVCIHCCSFSVVFCVHDGGAELIFVTKANS